jgi:DNA-binding MarR family transcriptional regulator
MRMTDEVRALDLIDSLYRLTRLAVDDARTHIAEVADLDVGEFMLLRAIKTGTSSPGDLSRLLSSHPAATSRTLTRLTRAGLVARTVDPDDARRSKVALTGEGERVAALIADRIRPELQRRLDRLDPGEARQLVASLRHLLAAEA